MSHRFRTMDGMRGVAAMIVLLGHAPEFFRLGYIPHFWLSVDLFFLMSGFVLGRTYEPRFAAGLGPREFIINRYIRLYPLYALGIVIGIVSGGATLLAGRGNLDAAGFGVAAVSGLLLLPSPVSAPGDLFPLNFPAWSLFLEIVANIAFVFFWRRLGTVAIVVASLALATLMLSHSLGGDVFGGTTWPTLHWGLVRIGFSFFLGLLLQRFHPGPRWHSDLAYLVPLLTAAIICVPLDTANGLVDVLRVVIAFPLLLWISGLIEPVHGRAMTALGLSSYPIYVLHVPVLSVLWRALLLAKLRPEVFAPALGILLMLGLFVLGLLLDRFYDAPIRRALVARIAVRARRDRRLTAIDTPL